METVVISSDVLAELQHENAELKALVKWYEEQFRLQKHRQFGAKSEKSEYDTDQLSIFNEAEVTSDETVPEPALIEVEKHYRKRTRLTKDRLPEDLPVETIIHDLPEAERICPDCGGSLHVMGQETRRELKIIPAKAVIVEHVSYTYACRACEKGSDSVPILKAPMPAPVIKGSFASPETVAYIMTQKYVMATPLYRQEQDWMRNGIMLSRQTMSNWLIRCSEDWLEPVFERLKAILRTHEVLHGDETTLQVLHEPGKSAQSKSYMWLFRTSGDTKTPIVLYEYQPDRRAKHAETFLSGFTGYLHADGYEGYHRLPGNIVVVGCWAHCRRKFDEALKTLPEEVREGSSAMRGKRYCDALFALEHEFAALSPEQRFEERQKRSKPLMEEFYAWAEGLGALPKNGLAKAVYYMQTQRKYLERYLLDGRLEISNNRAERSIKPFVIGRKNFLFANTVKGAKASSVIYSIIETAKENRLRPFEYLQFLFAKLPNAGFDDLDAVLPWGEAIPDWCRMQSEIETVR